MSGAQPPGTWHEAVRRLHTESGGVLNLDVVQRGGMGRLLGAALAGDADAADLVRIVSDALVNIDTAPAAASVQCASCGGKLPVGRFAIVVARPAVDNPQQSMALAICPRCGPTVGAIKAAATRALKLLWPDARRIEVTHPAGGGRA